jgi:hypothetical protein
LAPRDRAPNPFRLALTVGLLAMLALPGATGCARTPASPLPVPAMPPIEDPAEPVVPPVAPPEPKRDRQKDPVACQEARAQWKDATREAAANCSETNPCIVDSDCLVRTVGADPATLTEARGAMERACTPSGSITRVSCTESPAPCEGGRCVKKAGGGE